MIVEAAAHELLDLLFPHLAGVRVERVVLAAGGWSVRLEAVVRARAARCPACGHASRRVHSAYERWLADCGVGGREVVVRLRVRRFRCADPACPQRIFAGQVPGLTARYQRRSPALAATLAGIALALGGRAGARMARRLDAPVSRTTLLRLVRALPDPVPDATLRAVGVDEFALRRGHRYGTVLVDVETRRPLDLLADRSADALAVWLEGHPNVEVVCRDRAGPYADGAARGAPDAVQVADRWHLLHNLADAVERVVKRHRAALVEAPPAPAGPGSAGAEEVAVAPVEGPRAARTRRRHAEVHALAALGVGPTWICHALNLDPKTVRRYLRVGSPDDLLAPSAHRASALDPHKAHLARRFAEGCANAARLWDEVRRQGYRGSRRSVRRYLNTLAAPADRPRPPSVRQLRRWILRRPGRLDERDRARLEAACARCPALETTAALAAGFARLVRERRGEDLAAWAKEAETSEVPELAAFASGLRRDWDAVEAGLTLPWSSGAVEGHVNRIKTLKRQMYGRANLDLLRRRVLLAG